MVGGGARPPKETRLLEIALRLQAELARRHPHRRYVVIYDAETTYVDSWLWFMSKWRIGRLEIRRSLNLESSTAVAVRADERRMDDPSFVDSDVMRYALLLALSFEAKLARLSWLLGRPRAFDEQQARTGRWLITALLVDLAEEQDSLRRGHGRVDTPLLERRLSYLVRLRGFALAAPRDADEAKWSLLVELCAGIRALASSALAHAQLQERTQLETQARLALSHARDREAMQLPSADAS